jgi:hypothetical protein
MLNNAPGALVKQIIMEIFYWKLCIQCFVGVKSYLITINFVFYIFLVCFSSTSDTLFNMTILIFIIDKLINKTNIGGYLSSTFRKNRTLSMVSNQTLNT